MREWHLIQLVLTFLEVQLVKFLSIFVIFNPDFNVDVADVDIEGRFLEVRDALACRDAFDLALSHAASDAWLESRTTSTDACIWTQGLDN